MNIMKEKIKYVINSNTSIIRTIVPIIVIFTIIFGFFIGNCAVPTGSMEPTVMTDSRIVVNRLAYKNKDITRKDIIVFKYPDNEKINYLKRVIGMPGEIVTLKNGNVYINDKYLSENYLAESHNGNFGPYYVPKANDEVVLKNKVVDENGNISYCECYIGNYLVGVVDNKNNFLEKYCTYKDGKYLVIQDCYFCLGDNRDFSEDARFWKNKYVTKDKIVGKMFLNASDNFKKF